MNLKHKQMNKKFKLGIPLYDHHIWFFYGYKTKKELLKATGFLKLPVSVLNDIHLMGKTGVMDYMGCVYCDENNSNLPHIYHIIKSTHEDIVHETNHIVFFLAKYYCFEDDYEYQARLQEYLFVQILKRLK